MKRRTVLAMLVALFAFVIAGLGGASTAKAQIPQCPCTYRITVSCSIPPNCLPRVTTSWSNNAIAVQAIAACGTLTYMIPPPCPPQPNINWASLDGGITIAVPNGPPIPYNFPGCPRMCLSVKIDMFGCVDVFVLPCP